MGAVADGRCLPGIAHLHVRATLAIALLALIAGDFPALESAIGELEREGDFAREVAQMKWRLRAGRLASAVYAWRYRHRYRHRADWERDLAELEQRGKPEAQPEIIKASS